MAIKETEGVGIVGKARVAGVEFGTGAGGYVPDTDDPYYKLTRYEGNKTKCDNCRREFVSGEVVSVASGNENLVFCYSDALGGCVMAYVLSFGKALMGHPMRFGEGFLPEEGRTPNYPKSPVFATNDIGQTGPSFWQRLKSFFQ